MAVYELGEIFLFSAKDLLDHSQLDHCWDWGGFGEFPMSHVVVYTFDVMMANTMIFPSSVALVCTSPGRRSMMMLQITASRARIMFDNMWLLMLLFWLEFFAIVVLFE